MTTKKTPTDPQSNGRRAVRFRSRLIRAVVPDELKSLSEQMEKLSRSGYSPTKIAGVGKHLFVLLEHEHTLGMRTFGPMAQFFHLMQDYEDDADEMENEGTAEEPQSPEISTIENQPQIEGQA